jgi:hypothetical protein
MRALTPMFAAVALSSAALAQPLEVAFRGMHTLAPTTTDQYGASFTISGLSGITHRTGRGDEFLAVMDNSNKLVRLSVSFAPDGSITSASVLGGITLAETRDFEGIAFAPGTLPTSAGTVFLAEEGTPAVHEFDLATGARIQTLSTPAIFSTRRANFGFESLTRNTTGSAIWTANEEALTADGSVSSPTAGTLVRLLRLGGSTLDLAPSLQFAYLTESMHGITVNGARSGLCDLVALPSGRYLALERSFALGPTGFFQTRIFEISFAGATDISPLESLAGQTVTPVSKRSLYTGGLNNVEGLALGPRLSGPGRRFPMLGIIDDGDPLSMNAVVSFELTGSVACPADFNDDGRISVQDIFDFLAAYFSDSLAADVNATGLLTVQDVFDFLESYFTNCT